MTVDLTTGFTYTQTRYIGLTTPWKSCTFAVTISPYPLWTNFTYDPVTGNITINVTSTDFSLKNTTVNIHVVLTADMKNTDNGLPLDPNYTFDVIF